MLVSQHEMWGEERTDTTKAICETVLIIYEIGPQLGHSLVPGVFGARVENHVHGAVLDGIRGAFSA